MKIKNNKSWRAFVVSDEVYKSLELFALNKGIDSAVVCKCSVREALYLIDETKIFLLEYVPDIDQDLVYKLFVQRVHSNGGKVILLSSKDSMPEFNWLNSIEIDVVDNIPVEFERLDSLLKNIVTNKTSSVNGFAKIIGFLKFKPNNGTMTCALNTAAILSKKHKTLIIDFDLYFSPSSTFFDFEKNNYLAELLEKPNRIDSQLILSSVTEISKNLFILSSTIDLDKNTIFTNESIDRLIAICSELYEYVVVYLPFSETVYNHPIVFISDLIICVVTLDKANKKAYENMMPLLLKNNISKNIHVCVNYVKKHVDIDADQFFDDLEIKPIGTINFHDDLIRESRSKKVLAVFLDYDSNFSYQVRSLLINIGLIDESLEAVFFKKIKWFFKKIIGKNK